MSPPNAEFRARPQEGEERCGRRNPRRDCRVAPWELDGRDPPSLGRQNWETLQLTANLTRPRRVPETKPGTWRKRRWPVPAGALFLFYLKNYHLHRRKNVSRQHPQA